jgi:hypothetical protein
MINQSLKAECLRPACVEEVVPDFFYSIGGVVPAEDCRAWFPLKTNGLIPFQCYAFRHGKNFYLIDSAIPVLRREVMSGLREIIGSSDRRFFLMTRRELDTILNLPAIVQEFGFESVHCGGEMNPMDFFDLLDHANADAHGRMLADVPFLFEMEGHVRAADDLRLEMIKSPMMVLPTYWFFEESSGTLLCSDFWGFLPCKAPDRSDFTCASILDIKAADIQSFLNIKFDWLASIDTQPLAMALADIVRPRKILRICPTYGRMFEGEAVVQHLIEETLIALDDLSRQPRRNLLDGWEYRGIVMNECQAE